MMCTDGFFPIPSDLRVDDDGNDANDDDVDDSTDDDDDDDVDDSNDDEECYLKWGVWGVLCKRGSGIPELMELNLTPFTQKSTQGEGLV